MPRFMWLVVAVCCLGCARKPALEVVWPTAPNPAPLVAEADPLVGLTDKLRGYPKAPEADRAIALLDVALETAWSLPDPRDLLYAIIWKLVAADPVRGCERLRMVSVRLQKLDLPLREWDGIWASFAWQVAPHDPQLRNDMLRLAVAEGKRKLATEEFWKAPPVKPGELWDVEPQESLNRSRLGLTFRVRLWELVPMWDSDRETALSLLAHLLADAKAMGGYGGCVGPTYEETLHRALSGLNPDILITVLSFEETLHHTLAALTPPMVARTIRREIGWPRGRAGYLAWFAEQRWKNDLYDSFTEALALAAFEWGDQGATTLKILSHRDFALVWKISVRHPRDDRGEPHPRQEILGYLLGRWAWHDPDAALFEAEHIPGAAQQNMITVVANVWAYKRPEQIDRAVLCLDNYNRKGPSELASDELRWRKQGNPSRDTPATRPESAHKFPLPAVGPWVPPDYIQKLLADPGQVEEADREIHEYIQARSLTWPTDRLIEMANHIKSPRRLILTQLSIVSGLLRR
ncbi:MAG: hypothetical protein K8U57_12890 [Planctomycetes bacterium]|nr:hypothetical protein [Planctomycetota bacterium]